MAHGRARDERKERQWRHWIAEWQASGLSVRAFCGRRGLDPARLTVPPLDSLDLPHRRAAMLAVDAELTTSGAGGQLAAESLAKVLAMHLIRHVAAPRQPQRGRDGVLPQGRLRAVSANAVTITLLGVNGKGGRSGVS